jgi:hypothetical protein
MTIAAQDAVLLETFFILKKGMLSPRSAASQATKILILWFFFLISIVEHTTNLQGANPQSGNFAIRGTHPSVSFSQGFTYTGLYRPVASHANFRIF